MHMYTIEKFFHSTFWFGLGLLLNRTKYILLTIIVLPLGLTNVAIFYVSIHLINSLSSFANRLISSSYNRFLRDERFLSDETKLHSILNSSIILSFAIGVGGAFIVFLLAFPLGLLIKEPLLIKTIQLLSLVVPFLVIIRQVMQILSLLARYKEAVLFYNVLEASITLLFGYSAVSIFRSDVYTILAWQVVAMMLSSLFAVYLLHRVIPRFRLDPNSWHMPAKFSLTIFLNALSLMLFMQVDLLIVGFYFGLLTLGSYIGLLVAPRMIYTSATSIFGMFIHTIASFYNDQRKLTMFSEKVLRLSLIITIPFVLLLLLYPHETVRDILHIHIRIDERALQLLSLAFFIRIGGWLAGQLLVITKHARENMLVNATILLGTIPLLLFATPTYGIVGVSVILLVAASLEVAIKIMLTYIKLRVYFLSTRIIKTLAIGVGLYIIMHFFMAVGFVSFLIFLPLVYTVALILFRCVNLHNWLKYL